MPSSPLGVCVCVCAWRFIRFIARRSHRRRLTVWFVGSTTADSVLSFPERNGYRKSCFILLDLVSVSCLMAQLLRVFFLSLLLFHSIPFARFVQL